MATRAQRWFAPGKPTGWHKGDPATTRRARLLKFADKRRTKHNQYLQAACKALALANVTTDAETKRKARADSDYFFERARKEQ